MKKKVSLWLIISSLVTLIPMFLGIILWDKLPEKMATSFGIGGEVTGYSNKEFAVYGLPLILVLCNFLCVFYTGADPKRKNISDKIMGVVLSIIPLCSIFCGTLLYKDVLNFKINADMMGTSFLGLVFTVIGIILPKCKQNYTVGIKIPWTLNDEDNWNKTHKFAGKVFIAGGIITLISGFLGFVYASFVMIFIVALIPIVYSYIYYRKNKKDE